MKPRSKTSKWLFRFAAVVFAFLPFLATEIGLRLFGGSDDQTKLSQGQQPSIPLFTFDEVTQRYRTSLPYQQFFAEESFQLKGGQQAERVGSRPDKLIFVLGGSTVQGRPFAPDTAFPAWAEDFLNASSDTANIRIVNCGGVSFASDRLGRLVPELLSYNPDLIVIATGHNEFLEDHTYKNSRPASGVTGLIGELKTVVLIRDLLRPRSPQNASDDVPVVNHNVKAKLDNKAGYETYHYDQAWYADVMTQFRDSLYGMIDQCEAVKVPVCLIELAANHQDCAPLKSEHAPSVSAAQLTAWRASMAEAESAMKSMDWAKAISSLKDCVTHSPEHALSHFRLARCLRLNEDVQAASQHFQLAVNCDICPLRMKSDLVRSIRSIAEERSVPLIDCEELLKPMQEDGGVEFGFDLFLDHVHPTIRGHQVIGRKLAETIGELEGESGPELLSEAQILRIHEQRIAKLSAAYFSNGRRRIGWLENWARAEKTLVEITPQTTEDLTQRMRRQLELRDDKLVSQLAAVLVKNRDGNQRLINLATDFQNSGQQKPALVALQHVVEEELSETQLKLLRTLRDRQLANSDVEHVDVSPMPEILTDKQRSLVRDILEQGHR